MLFNFLSVTGTDRKDGPQDRQRRRFLYHFVGMGHKISHLFKRLTLSAGAHFVNSLPPCPAGVFPTSGGIARRFFSHRIDPISDGKRKWGNEMKNCVDMKNRFC
jgi:hypothetical protein